MAEQNSVLNLLKDGKLSE